MPSTMSPALRCAAVTSGPYPRRWGMRVLATLARSGLAQPVGHWIAGGRSDRTQLERLCCRHVERRASSLAPMAAPEETLGLPVLPIGDPGSRELDAVLDFRADGGDDRAWAQRAPLGRWILRIGGGKSPGVGAERVLFAGRFPKRATLAQTVDAVLLNLPDWYEIACRKFLARQICPAADAARPLPPPTPTGLGAAWLAGRLRALRALDARDLEHRERATPATRPRAEPSAA